MSTSRNDVTHVLFNAKTKPDPMDLVARRAVIVPLTGDRAASIESAQDLVVKWRKCLSRMYGAGLPAYLSGKGAWWSCRNCRPCGYGCHTKLHVCSHDFLCPFCYGRYTQVVLKSVFRGCRALTPAMRREHVLVGLRINLRDDCMEESDLKGFHEWMKKDLEWRKGAHEKLQDAGSHFSFSMAPRRGAHCWSVTRRAVLLMHQDAVVEREELPEGSWLRVLKLSRTLNAFKMARLVARTLVYPKGLLLGDPRRVKVWLDARRGHRLSATYGLFRLPRSPNGTRRDYSTRRDNSAARAAEGDS